MRFDYLKKTDPATRVDLDMAVQLCCLQIKCFFREVPQMSLEKKSNLEYLEREVGSLIYYFYVAAYYNDFWGFFHPDWT